MAKYNRLGQQSFWYSLGNFFLNFAIAVVWLGRWTIKLLKQCWRKWR
ncbi:MAG: hypothetical protein PUJ23_01795 [Veillonellaceae bacterium]|nr:hypothetical protein [Veillonellaceae bacterium]